MFKSPHNFHGLDDMFQVGTKGHLTSWEEVENRLNQLDNLYKEWPYGIWKVSRNKTKSSVWSARIVANIDLLRQAAQGYVLGSFVTCILSSSAAVEGLLRTVLEVRGKIKSRILTPNEVNTDNWYLVSTMDDEVEYFGTIGRSKWLSRIVMSKGNYAVFTYPSLKDLIDMGKKSEVPVQSLSTPLDDHSGALEFVVRRDLNVHAKDYEITLMEQISSMNNRLSVVLEGHQTRREFAFRQYSMASSFFSDVLNWLWTEYGVYDRN